MASTELQEKETTQQEALYDELRKLFAQSAEHENRNTFVQMVHGCIGKHVKKWFPKSPEIQNQVISDQLILLTMDFITDEMRKSVVIQHAYGENTAGAVDYLIDTDEGLYYLFQIVDNSTIMRKKLIHNLAYLKPTSSRFPKKFQSVWDKARAEYKKAIKDIPLSSSVEQVATLAKDAELIDRMLDVNNPNLKNDTALKLINTKIKLVSTLNKMTTRNEIQTGTSALNPQVVAVIERLSVMIDTQDEQALTELINAITTHNQKALPTTPDD